MDRASLEIAELIRPVVSVTYRRQRTVHWHHHMSEQGNLLGAWTEYRSR
ncbi:hypothetical protein Pd630_LPD15039 (plasmid) [Rhodococcus opacus PD630]|nr:hypothetical protein Pd630_LPD15039 [Rhodococcus opacus PD630]